jgi:hypothetical protein
MLRVERLTTYGISWGVTTPSAYAFTAARTDEGPQENHSPEMTKGPPVKTSLLNSTDGPLLNSFLELFFQTI